MIGAFALLPYSGTALAQSSAAGQAVSGDPYAAHIAEASQRFGIPAAWIRAVQGVESGGDMRAVSPKGAMGLMQIMPDTWAGLRLRYRLGRDPFDPRDNIMAGAAYLREMHDRYGNVVGMLAAYNAGPARYDDYLATGRALPAETRAYVATIAPMIGGGTLAGGSVPVASPPPDWRDAPLFVALSTGSKTATAAQSGASPDGSAAAVPRQNPAPLDQQSGDLFVARASAGEPK